ncbi:MAG: hypothetical protein M3Q69_03105 [Acidobacteriota bacterium]|nr:hypothetical protein [Acidobacteriota bacterium]
MDEQVILGAITRLGDRIDEQIARLDAKVDALRDETLSHFDAIYHRFDRLETEYETGRGDG